MVDERESIRTIHSLRSNGRDSSSLGARRLTPWASIHGPARSRGSSQSSVIDITEKMAPNGTAHSCGVAMGVPDGFALARVVIAPVQVL